MEPGEHSGTTRLEEVKAQLRRHREGLTSQELAEALGVDASTIRRDFTRLATTDSGLRRRGRRYTLDFHRSQRSLQLSSDEVLALYLACRLLTRHQSVRNPHAESAMRKLALSVRDDAPRLSRYIDDAAHLAHSLPERVDAQQVLEVLTQAISEGRIVALRYHNQVGEISERRLHPYALEPYGETNEIYAIGFDEVRHAIRTFRVDRIDVATLLADRFDVPLSFNPSRLFSEAWGVVWRETEPQPVSLRFSGATARVVQEGFWHPSQHLLPQPDGSCIVRFRVSEPNEMRRWILQWGSEVEVLAPDSLRAELAAECVRMGHRYVESAISAARDELHDSGAV